MSVSLSEKGERVVGSLQLLVLPGIARRGAWRGQIEAVRVASDCRGRGIRQKMLRWAVEECRARGCSMVQLTSNATRADALASGEGSDSRTAIAASS
jgi:GNAT superfamily N-acetyltransferase